MERLTGFPVFNSLFLQTLIFTNNLFFKRASTSIIASTDNFEDPLITI